MSNDVSSILQTLAPQHKVPGQAGKVSSSAAPVASEKPDVPKSDRVSLTEKARHLQSAVGQNPHLTPASGTPAQHAQRPTPAMANMLQAFLTTAEMDGFDAQSDLNSDGVINFHDLAALRDLETGAGPDSTQDAVAQLKRMTEAFLNTSGDKEFDGSSDLNGDGTINFHDLAMLRAKMTDS